MHIRASWILTEERWKLTDPRDPGRVLALEVFDRGKAHIPATIDGDASAEDGRGLHWCEGEAFQELVVVSFEFDNEQSVASRTTTQELRSKP